LYFLPVSLVALLPAIPMGIIKEQPYIIAFDMSLAASMGFIALQPRLSLRLRKIFVSLLLYVFAIVSIANLGSYGPGFLYLMATTVFATLIFSARLGYVSVALHFLTCSVFALVIHLHLFPTPLLQQYTTSSWVAFSSNLLFLSSVLVILISKIINGLESTILQELELQSKLKEEVAQTAELNSKLMESKSHYKSLFVQNPSPMWVVEAESYRFLQVNDAAINSYGYTRAEFLNMTVKELRFSINADGTDKDLKEQYVLGKAHRYITQHQKKNQRIFDVELRSNTIVFEGKQVILAIGRDITQQNSYIQAIEEQNRKLQDIAYIQSHSVRAPLANIMGLVELIKMNNETIENLELIERLDVCANAFDVVIKKIADGTLVYDIQGLNQNEGDESPL
jgi:PAS domain S-box-containing protein